MNEISNNWMVIALLILILSCVWRIFSWFRKLKEGYGMNIRQGSWLLVKPNKATKDLQNGLIVYLTTLSVMVIVISLVLFLYLKETYFYAA